MPGRRAARCGQARCVPDAREPGLLALPGRGQAPGRRAEARRPGAVVDPRVFRRRGHPGPVLPQRVPGHLGQLRGVRVRPGRRVRARVRPVLRVPVPRVAERRHGDEAQGRDALLVPVRGGLRGAEEGGAADPGPGRRERLGVVAGQVPGRRRLPHVRQVPAGRTARGREPGRGEVAWQAGPAPQGECRGSRRLDREGGAGVSRRGSGEERPRHRRHRRGTARRPLGAEDPDRIGLPPARVPAQEVQGPGPRRVRGVEARRGGADPGRNAGHSGPQAHPRPGPEGLGRSLSGHRNEVVVGRGRAVRRRGT